MGKQYILTPVTLFLGCDAVSLAEISEHFGRNTPLLRDLTLLMELEYCCEMWINSYQKKGITFQLTFIFQEWKKWHDLCVAV